MRTNRVEKGASSGARGAQKRGSDSACVSTGRPLSTTAVAAAVRMAGAVLARPPPPPAALGF
eukprot:11209072-Lingulodinium_polyedra.AAC.1